MFAGEKVLKIFTALKRFNQHEGTRTQGNYFFNLLETVFSVKFSFYLFTKIALNFFFQDICCTGYSTINTCHVVFTRA